MSKRHEEWQEAAARVGVKLWKDLNERDKTVDYACQRPHLSGRMVEQNTGEKMSRFAIDMARLRRQKKQGDVTTLDDIIQKTKPSPFET